VRKWVRFYERQMEREAAERGVAVGSADPVREGA
jgi:hypothetical protein